MIRVLIERHVADELSKHYEQASRETLQKAMHFPGFISGEALHNTSDPNHRVILATYRSENDWLLWQASDERREMMDQINPMLETEEKITVFEH
ncbi:antibiotic biosynthesis monooxygenase family protein [Marinobacterium sediminicola]|uniref:Heme-degrading monooxygenase HmoA n=1 Tax=Marinobacterium sediminicola TaxID=518898 RepID=A0ABY1RVQ3_9GAMM|nr:antibiotic biosynthesis monooxygenase [Marinobacterium sediminicola]ULG70588.1 antibiotic biosynthesis monooxygenase [Marinobacterium sediminicola]SMR68929.1 Heme-degrading monooxygenase HmoA [Marinobacterium sediminicola]